MAKVFRCSIVTPSKKLMEQDIAYASIPAWDGQQGVMANQSPVLTRLGVGSLRIDMPDGTTGWYFIDGGFAQIQPSQLTLVTEAAVPADELSEQDASAELAEANARVASSGQDQEQISRDQMRAYAKRHLARAHGR